jgi:DNA gyrase subunit A
MLVTNAGKTIRMPVGGEKPIRIVSRGSQGVILFDTEADERVVSVEHIPANGEAGNGETEDGDDNGEGATPAGE